MPTAWRTRISPRCPKRIGFSLDTPVCDLPDDALDRLLYGTRGEKIRISYQRENGSGSFSAPFEGIITSLERRYRETNSDGMKSVYEGYMSATSLPRMQGSPAASARRWRSRSAAKTIAEVSRNVGARRARLLRLPSAFRKAADHRPPDFKGGAVAPRLPRGRGSRTISRLRAAPARSPAARHSAFAWPRKSARASWACCTFWTSRRSACTSATIDKLLNTLKKLRDQGNTLIVVEHDEETMLRGGLHRGHRPGRGRQRRARRRGGHARGDHAQSRFAHRAVPVRQAPRAHSGNGAERRTGWLTVRGARANNLKNVDRDIPARRDHLRHRRVRQRQILAGQRNPVQVPVAAR